MWVSVQVTSDMLRLFHCQSIYGEAYLVADLSIKCFEDTWIVAAVFGLVGLVAYTIGIPVIFCRLIATQASSCLDDILLLQQHLLHGT